MSAIAPRRSAEASVPNLEMNDTVTSSSSEQKRQEGEMPKKLRHEEAGAQGPASDAWAPAAGVHVSRSQPGEEQGCWADNSARRWCYQNRGVVFGVWKRMGTVCALGVS